MFPYPQLLANTALLTLLDHVRSLPAWYSLSFEFSLQSHHYIVFTYNFISYDINSFGLGFQSASSPDWHLVGAQCYLLNEWICLIVCQLCKLGPLKPAVMRKKKGLFWGCLSGCSITAAVADDYSPQPGSVYITQLCLALCGPTDCNLPGSSISGKFSRQKYWSRWAFPPPGDPPGPGIQAASLALAGRFFITSASW